MGEHSDRHRLRHPRGKCPMAGRLRGSHHSARLTPFCAVDGLRASLSCPDRRIPESSSPLSHTWRVLRWPRCARVRQSSRYRASSRSRDRPGHTPPRTRAPAGPREIGPYQESQGSHHFLHRIPPPPAQARRSRSPESRGSVPCQPGSNHRRPGAWSPQRPAGGRQGRRAQADGDPPACRQGSPRHHHWRGSILEVG